MVDNAIYWINKIDVELFKLSQVSINNNDLKWLSYFLTKEIIQGRLEDKKLKWQTVQAYERFNSIGGVVINSPQYRMLRNIAKGNVAEQTGMSWLLTDVDRFKREVFSQHKRLSMPADFFQQPAV